jgi:8-oxo-dGTP pyrophosphatase MutT (NUDIX family)
MAHIHEMIDMTVSVYIVRDGAVLLHHHAKTGKWLPPGGHIELDEDPNEAAIREAKEETGFDVELAGTVPVTSDVDDERELVPPRWCVRARERK